MKEHIDYFKNQMKGCDILIKIATDKNNKQLLKDHLKIKEHLEFAIMCMEYFIVGGNE